MRWVSFCLHGPASCVWTLMLRRSLFVLLGVLALVLVVVVGAVAVALWRPDLVKGPIERLASAQLGLPVTIEGPLAVHPGRVTTVEVSGLRVAAPEWAQAPTLATVRQLRLGVDLGRWWQDGSLVVTELRLDQPQAALERDAQGRTSWPSGGGSQEETEGSGSGQGGPTLPEIHDLTITDGSVSYKDAVTGVEVATALATTAPQAGSARDFGGLRLDGQGRVRGDQVTFDLEVGSPVLLTQAGAPFPIKGELRLADTRLRLDGEARDPLTLKGLSLALDLASPDPTKLLALLGQPVPSAPPDLAVKGRFTRDDAALSLSGLEVRWGESRIDGEIAYDPRPERPRVDGRLHSALLDLVALQPVLTAQAPEPASNEPASGGGDTPAPGPLVTHDGQLALTVDRLRAPGIELHDLAATLALADGRLLAEPVRVGFPQGRLEGRIEAADLTQEPLAATVDMKADGVDLAPLAALAGLDQKVAGRLTGTLTGTVEGTAPETILAESELAFQGTLAGPAYGPYAAREVGFTAQLADGKAVLDPIRLVMPQGELGGRVATGQLGGGQAPEATVDLEARQLDLTPFLVPTVVPEGPQPRRPVHRHAGGDDPGCHARGPAEGERAHPGGRVRGAALHRPRGARGKAGCQAHGRPAHARSRAAGPAGRRPDRPGCDRPPRQAAHERDRPHRHRRRPRGHPGCGERGRRRAQRRAEGRRPGAGAGANPGAEPAGLHRHDRAPEGAAPPGRDGHAQSHREPAAQGRAAAARYRPGHLGRCAPAHRAAWPRPAGAAGRQGCRAGGTRRDAGPEPGRSLGHRDPAARGRAARSGAQGGGPEPGPDPGSPGDAGDRAAALQPGRQARPPRPDLQLQRHRGQGRRQRSRRHAPAAARWGAAQGDGRPALGSPGHRRSGRPDRQPARHRPWRDRLAGPEGGSEAGGAGPRGAAGQAARPCALAAARRRHQAQGGRGAGRPHPARCLRAAHRPRCRQAQGRAPGAAPGRGPGGRLGPARRAQGPGCRNPRPRPAAPAGRPAAEPAGGGYELVRHALGPGAGRHVGRRRRAQREADPEQRRRPDLAADGGRHAQPAAGDRTRLRPPAPLRLRSWVRPRRRCG